MLSSLFSTTLIFAVALSSVRADTASNSTSDLSSTADLSSSSDLSTADVSTLSSDVVSSPDSLIAAASSFAPKKQCKCIPGDSCFPSDIIWKLFGLTTGGRLVKTKPVAVSCYPGPDQNAARCAVVNANWQDATFQADDVVGLAYPTNVTCPPVPAGQTPGSCTLGVSPSYAVDATEPWHVSVAVAFARLSNIRLVVKNTGHDMLGRSEGAGGLEVWIRHLRKGITFQKKFKSDTGCTKSGWTGSAIKIGGAYTWGDVYATAKANNVIVVGGGTPSVGAIGGWMQGGGHGPASRQFGLGADQVLELDVVLSSGLIVTANACQNSDLFFALRGGGGGTYGVVISTTVKAHPNAGMVVQHLAMGALTTNTTGLLDTIAIVTSAYPDMNDAGYAGYGQWSIESPTPIFATFTAAYVHGIYMFGKTEKDARAAFDATRTKLAPYSSSVFVSETYTTYPDYWSFYEAESGVEPPVGTPATLASRLFDRPSLTKNFSALRKMIGTLAGTPGQFTFNSVEIVGGGQIFKDKSDPNSGLLPAWRTSYFSNIVARGYPLGTPQSVVDQIQNDITFTKLAAMKALAPNTGSYMNEADRLDPDWKNAFYGSNYNKLLGIKQKYDPASVFFCPTCVGSDGWGEDGSRRLCKVNSS